MRPEESKDMSDTARQMDTGHKRTRTSKFAQPKKPKESEGTGGTEHAVIVHLWRTGFWDARGSAKHARTLDATKDTMETWSILERIRP
jgi:hypothetical protein